LLEQNIDIRVIRTYQARHHGALQAKCGSTDGALSGGRLDEPPSTEPIDPRAFGFTKAAYTVGEALDLLSIGRTALYAAVRRGDLKRVKFGTTANGVADCRASKLFTIDGDPRSAIARCTTISATQTDAPIERRRRRQADLFTPDQLLVFLLVRDGSTSY
jgi:hypothetical protein